MAQKFFLVGWLQLRQPSKEVKDFVVNCMTMAVLHLPAQLQVLNVSYPPFRALFTFMKQTANEYRQQIFTIVEKIDAEKFKNC